MARLTAGEMRAAQDVLRRFAEQEKARAEVWRDDDTMFGIIHNRVRRIEAAAVELGCASASTAYGEWVRADLNAAWDAAHRSVFGRMAGMFRRLRRI